MDIWLGHQVCNAASIVSYLLFIDDTIISYQASEDQVFVIQEFLVVYESMWA